MAQAARKIQYGPNRRVISLCSGVTVIVPVRIQDSCFTLRSVGILYPSAIRFRCTAEVWLVSCMSDHDLQIWTTEDERRVPGTGYKLRRQPSVPRCSRILPLRAIHFSNGTSEPLFGCHLYLKLFHRLGSSSMRSSKRTKIAEESRDWYSWLLPSLCLMLLTVLLLKH